MIKWHFWARLLLLDICCSFLIQDQKQATQVLTRSKRGNDGIFEETRLRANLERECYEETCNLEELGEIWTKSNAGDHDVTGGSATTKLIKTELLRLRSFMSKTKNSDIQSIHYTLLNQPCTVDSETFLLHRSFSVPSVNATSIIENISQLCNSEYTEKCENGYGRRSCSCKPGNVYIDEYCNKTSASGVTMWIGIVVATCILLLVIIYLVSKFKKSGGSSDEPDVFEVETVSLAEPSKDVHA